MGKKQTVVKNINAMQGFGSMDVLCVDKTGTLTQDRIVLEYPLDVHGNVDERVLRHAFLNSYHQTGLRNLMDEASWITPTRRTCSRCGRITGRWTKSRSILSGGA